MRTLRVVPEGDSIHRAARRLQALVGERVEVETPHPRAAALNLVTRLDGRRLERVEAVGKNLLLRFEGGVTLRSHLRMKGRWWVQPRGRPLHGKPWLVLRTPDHEAVQWNGPILELRDDVLRRLALRKSGIRYSRIPDALKSLGPDILAEPPDLPAIVPRLRGSPFLPLAEALQRQELVSGIGNMWAAEALWSARLSPWIPVEAVPDERLEALLTESRRLMSSALERARSPRQVYRRAGRPCRRCGTLIRSRGQGDANRTAYWCPTCQQGGEHEPAQRTPDVGGQALA